MTVLGTSEIWPAIIYDKGGAIYNVKHPDFGASGNLSQDDQPRIQATLDWAGIAGGVVIVPAGGYLIGPGDTFSSLVTPGIYSLKVPNNVVLWVMAGATIWRNFQGGGDANATIRNADLTSGNKNIAIIGTGTIRAVSQLAVGKHVNMGKVEGFRIHDVEILGRRSVGDATYFGPGDWNVQLTDCTDTLASGLRINSGASAGEDGYHLYRGTRHVVSNCAIKSGDDCIALTIEDSAGAWMEDVSISTCNLESRYASLIKVSVEAGSTVGIRRVVVSDITGKVGLGGTTGAYAICAYDATGPVVGSVAAGTGLVDGLSIDNVRVNLTNMAFAGSEVGLQLQGVRNVKLDKIDLDDCPTYGYNFINSSDITMVDCGVKMRGANTRQALILEGVSRFTARGGKLAGSGGHNVHIGPNGNACFDINFDDVYIGNGALRGVWAQAVHRLSIRNGSRIASNGTDGIFIDQPYAGSGTVTVAAGGATTFSVSQAASLLAGFSLMIASKAYRILTFNGTTGATLAPAFGQSVVPAIAATSFTIVPVAEVDIKDVVFEGTPSTSYYNGPAGAAAAIRIRNCPGLNPVGVSAVTPSGSPFTITAGYVDEMIYVYGGTVSNISKDGVTIATQSNTSFRLSAGRTAVITYSVAPSITREVL